MYGAIRGLLIRAGGEAGVPAVEMTTPPREAGAERGAMSDLDDLAAAAGRRRAPRPAPRSYVPREPRNGNPQARTAGAIIAILGTLPTVIGLKFDNVDWLRVGVVIVCVGLLLFAIGRAARD